MDVTTLAMTSSCYSTLQQHLLGSDSGCEEAAFLFCELLESSTVLRLRVKEFILLPEEAFVSRSAWYLELSPATRGAVIKRAHDLGACLVECHSHPGQRHAEFSASDLAGFSDFVPHVRWRLPGRPYGALVFAANSFDGLVWLNEDVPGELNVIELESGRLQATGATLNALLSRRHYG